MNGFILLQEQKRKQQKRHQIQDKESSGKKHSKSSSKQRLHRKKSKKFVGLSEDDEGADPDAPHIPQSVSKESTTSHKLHSQSFSYGSDGLEEAIGQENVDYLQFNPENTHLPVVRRRGSVSHDSGDADAPPPAQQSAPPKRGITRSKSDDYLQFNPEDPSSVLKKTGEDSIHTKSPVKKVTRPGLSRASSMNRVARPTVTKSSRSSGTMSMRNLLSSGGKKSHMMMNDDMGAIEEADEPSSSHHNEAAGDAAHIFKSSALPELSKIAGVHG